MPQFIESNSYLAGLASKQIGLTAATGALEIRLTNTPHDPSWTMISDLTVVTNHFADETLPITNDGNDIAGDGAQDAVVADKDFTSVGSDTGPFQRVYVVDPTATANQILGHGDFGSPQTVSAGADLEFRTSNANDVLFSLIAA